MAYATGKRNFYLHFEFPIPGSYRSDPCCTWNRLSAQLKLKILQEILIFIITTYFIKTTKNKKQQRKTIKMKNDRSIGRPR